MHNGCSTQDKLKVLIEIKHLETIFVLLVINHEKWNNSTHSQPK